MRPDHGAVLGVILRQDFHAFTRKTFHTLCPGQTFVSGWFLLAITDLLNQSALGRNGG